MSTPQGLSTTVVYGSFFTGTIYKDVDESGKSVAGLDDTGMQSTNEEKCASTLTDLGTKTIIVQYKATMDAPALLGTTDTLVITDPEGAIETGTAFVENISAPIKMRELMQVTMTFRWNGKTHSYTASV